MRPVPVAPSVGLSPPPGLPSAAYDPSLPRPSAPLYDPTAPYAAGPAPVAPAAVPQYALQDMVQAALASTALLGSYSVFAQSGGSAIADGSAATLDYSAALLRLIDTRTRPGQRWRILSVYGVPTGSGAGCWELSSWTAGNIDLGHDMGVRVMYLPVGCLLPDTWDGQLRITATNRTGAASQLYCTLFVAPVDP